MISSLNAPRPPVLKLIHCGHWLDPNVSDEHPTTLTGTVSKARGDPEHVVDKCTGQTMFENTNPKFDFCCETSKPFHKVVVQLWDTESCGLLSRGCTGDGLLGEVEEVGPKENTNYVGSLVVAPAIGFVSKATRCVSRICTPRHYQSLQFRFAAIILTGLSLRR